MGRKWTAEEKKAASERAKKQYQDSLQEAEQKKEDVQAVPSVADEQDLNELKRQVAETQALLQAFMSGQQSAQSREGGTSVGLNKGGKLQGEVTRYLLDPANYPDPTIRLRKEPRLNSLAFDYHYELEYEVGVSSYENKAGVNMREPKFLVTLNRIVLDDQGEQTPKRYIARRLVFHEDPQAAIVIARENGIEVDQSDEKLFLNEMRYLRVRDWLFGIFWPKPANEKGQIQEEVIGGTLVQVFTKSSEEASEVDFDKLKTKLV